jgi:uncharacterized protein (TIGR02996 family)
MAEGSETTGDEQGFLDALERAPADLAAHLAYATWLAERGHTSRAEALRAWVAFLRVPFSAAGLPEVTAAYRAYQGSLYQKDAEWIEALEKVRRWISQSLAEKIVRISIGDVFGAAAAEAWAVKVTPCLFDDRWSGGYEGEETKDGVVRQRKGTFFVNQIVGSGSGHVFSA